MIPEIRESYEASTTDKDQKKILILSSSAFTNEWGNFAKVLEENLNETNQKWKVYNAAGIGFSSLDNLNTFAALSDLEFDLVIFYNGINDARLNNCPNKVFKSDYSHVRWYNEIKCIQRHTEMNMVLSPFFVDFCLQKIRAALFREEFIPENYKDFPEWLNYGNEMKSLDPFMNNLSKIINLKKENSSFIIIPFMTYIPQDYSFEKFKTHNLDYSFHENSREVEVWGTPVNVEQYMYLLNQEINSSFSTNKQVEILNLNKQVNHAQNFADICHFSPEGIKVFNEALLESEYFKH